MRLFTDERCLDHPAPPGFPERPERLRGILAALSRNPLASIQNLAADAMADEQAVRAIARIHAEGHADRLRRAAARRDALLDTADNPIGPSSYGGALGAVRATLAALEATLAGTGAPTFAAVRPPGHHAERAQAMGFCFFNNVAIAAAEAVARHGVERIAIYDFDVHHGNGTQHLFEANPDVLYVSTHQFPFYPGTGAAGERGIGPGTGATLNVPLAAGGDDATYRAAHREQVFPALRAFRPDLLLVSAGFDAWRHDPLGGMKASGEGFAEWGRELHALAGEVCGGRMLSVLEGGYDLAALPGLVQGYLSGQYVEFT